MKFIKFVFHKIREIHNFHKIREIHKIRKIRKIHKIREIREIYKNRKIRENHEISQNSVKNRQKFRFLTFFLVTS